MYLMNYNKFDIAYDIILERFCDENLVPNNDDVSSTSPYLIIKSSKQTFISKPIIESKFIALKVGSQEAKWSKGLT
ncbi:hypothetical protein CR513_43151, partial [Mucuna pruriens]